MAPDLKNLLMFLVSTSILASIAWSIFHATRRRELDHRERMKALEMGLVPAGDRAWPAAVCIAIGAGVPITAFVVALFASLNPPSTVNEGDKVIVWSSDQAAVYFGCVWGGAISVSIVSAIGGSLLGWILLGRRPNRSGPTEAPRWTTEKPQFDPDAYDTVATRG